MTEGGNVAAVAHELDPGGEIKDIPKLAVATPEEIVEIAEGLGQTTLLADETRLPREVVLEMFMTPTNGRRRGNIRERRTTLGEAEYGQIRPSSAFIMPQIRNVYSAPYIRMLGGHIQHSYGGQLQNCTTAIISEGNVEGYLESANQYFGSEVEPDELPWHKKFGGFLITISGHNRQLGIAYVNNRVHGHPDRGIPVVTRFFRDPPFWSIIEMQAAENSGMMPQSWERARAIKTYVDMTNAEGSMKKTTEVAAMFNVDPDQIPRALRYESLPLEIRELVMEDALPYSGAFELDRLKPLYAEVDVIELARKFASEELSAEKIRQEVAKREMIHELPDEVRVFVDEDLIKPNQAKELHRMHLAGCKASVIEEVARWVSLTQPKASEIAEYAKKKIDAARTGQLDVFNDAAVSEEDQDALAEEYGRLVRQGQLSSAAALAGKHLRHFISMADIGALRDGVEDRPFAMGIGGQVGDLISRLDTGEEIDVELLSQLVESLSAIAEKRPDERVSALIAQLADLLDMEANETSASQTARNAARIKSLIAPEEPAEKQDALF